MDILFDSLNLEDKNNLLKNNTSFKQLLTIKKLEEFLEKIV